ncbi:MAG: hypothetical protein WCT85_00600 [Parachlamydiales bacterium]|jgi:hypothetical protein
MLAKKILGIIIAILGVAMLISSFYIKSQVEQGRKQISEAQHQVDQGKALFSLNPVTKEVGKEIARPVEKKIKAGTEKANLYNTIALYLQIGGCIFIILGSGIVFIGNKKK